MELTLDNNRATFMITAVTDSEIKVNDEIFKASVVLSSTKITDWSPQSFSDLTQTDLEILAAPTPKLVIIGTGKEHALLKPELMTFFLEKNIGIECMNTAAACRTFNVLMSEGRDAVAGLII